MLFCIFIILSVKNLSAQNADAEKLKKLNQDWLNSILTKDSSTLSGILAEDFIMVNPSGQKLSKKDNLSAISSTRVEFSSIVVDSITVLLISPQIGIVSCWTRFTYKADGKEGKGKNCYQDIYRKRKNKWQAVAAHVTLLQ